MTTLKSNNPFRNPSPLNDSSSSAPIPPSVTGISSASSFKPAEPSSAASGGHGALNSAPALSISTTTTSAAPSTSASLSSETAAATTLTGPSETGLNRSGSRRVDPLDDLPEEDPPAYTPGPDLHQGEATVEYGPSRPFQPPPPRPSQPPVQSPQHTGWSTVQNHVRPNHHAPPPSLLQQITGSLVDRLNNVSVGGSSYNHNRYQGFPGQPAGPQLPPGTWRPPPGPPPGHVQPQNTGAPPPSSQYQPPPHPPPSSSDFARDFYEAGPGPEASGEVNAAGSTAPGTYAPP
ncbi:hypothetical protein V5O48_017117, partial [Marasmius crinis-equi]